MIINQCTQIISEHIVGETLMIQIFYQRLINDLWITVNVGSPPPPPDHD